MIATYSIHDARLLLIAALSIHSGFSLGAETLYEYDTLNRVTRATDSDGTVIEYGYDAAGNRTSHVVQATTPTFPLTLARTGAGSGTLSGGGTYAQGAPVTLTATPAAGSIFTGWSPSPCAADFAMPAADLTCTANFVRLTLAINDVALSEGNSGSTPFAFTVSLNGPSAAAVTLKYATASGTATTTSDFSAAGGTLTFSPGEVNKTVNVAVKGDTAVEADETFSVKLSSPVGATLADALGLGTIRNDDLPALRIKDAAKAEGRTGTSALVFTVTLTPAAKVPVTVALATADGTATAGSDYLAASGTLSFAPGQTSKTVSVAVIGDTAVEDTETFALNLSGPVNATLADAEGLGTIRNDDFPTLAINDVSQAEGAGAQVFNVTLSQAVGFPVTVRYATANGTALAGRDYTAATGTLTFAPGVTSLPVSVGITNDTLVERDETFLVRLSTPTNATLADGQGQGTIRNDD